MYGTPPSGGLNARRVAKYSDFGRIEGYTRKRCKIGGKLVLITNIGVVNDLSIGIKIVTLNDHERHNGPYYGRPM